MWVTGNDKNSNFYIENRFIKSTYCNNFLPGPCIKEVYKGQL